MKTLLTKIRPLYHHFYPVMIYGIIGVCNTALSFSLFTLFWHFLHINYLLATSFAFAITACIQFFANRKVTFKCTTGNLRFQIIKYLMMLGTNYLVTISVVHFSVAMVELSPYIGMCMATACTATISFLLFKFWIFRHHIQI